jgi:MFS family permease
VESSARPEGVELAEPAASNRPRIFYGYYMLGSMMGIHWYMSAAFVYGFGALFVPILDTFGWSRGVGSLAASFRQPVGGAMGPLVGMFVDRYGARPVVIAGVWITGLGIMSLAWIQALWMLFVSFGVISLGMSATLGVGFNSAIVNWFHRNRGRALGIGYSGAILSGPFVGVVVWMEAAYGWRQTAFMLGVGMLLIGLPLALIVRTRPSDIGQLPDGDDPSDPRAVEAARVAAAGPQASAREALGDRNLWLLGLVYGLLSMGVSGFMLHQIPYFESLGFSRAAAASTLAFFTVLSVVGRLGTGLVLDWMGRRGRDLRLVPAGLLAIQALALFYVAHVEVYWQMIPFALVFGIAFGGMIPSRPILITRLFGLRQYGTIQGTLNFLVIPFSVVSPLLLGLVFDWRGDYYLAVMLLAALNAAGIAFAFLLRLPPSPSEGGAPPVEAGPREVAAEPVAS